MLPILKKILIVEDESTIRDMIRFALQPAGFEVLEAESATIAEKYIAQALPDLILLDWMLPDRSGISFANQLKKEAISQNIPIIMLTAKAEEDSKLKGFEIGVDDYITKPFSPRELIARIKTVLRRGLVVSPQGMITAGALSLNVHLQILTIQDKVIALSPIEYKLIHFFLTHQERIYSRKQLLDYVWGRNHYIEERTVDVQIRRLRNRFSLEECRAYIQTIRGSGYLFTTKSK